MDWHNSLGRKMRKVILLLVLAIPIGSYAQSWKQEPSSVLGITLGSHLSNDAINDCGGVMSDNRKSDIAACAMSKPTFGEGNIPIGGIPISAFTEGVVLREDGIVTAIQLGGRSESYEEAKKVLILKYGKPSRSTNTTVQNNLGGTFKSEKLIWKGKRVSLALDQRFGQVDKFSAVFTYLHTPIMAPARDNIKLKQDADKL